MRPIEIPDECVPFIRWQRSRFNRPEFSDEDVKREYGKWVMADFDNIARHLPPKVETLLDIGCGMAGVDVFLAQHLPGVRLRLLDGDGDKVAEGQGYNRTSEPYNSRAATEALLAANGVGVDRWYDVGTTELLEADVIISLASLGYHYPFSTYRLKGLVICDIRRSHLEQKRGEVIFRGPKYDRRKFLCP